MELRKPLLGGWSDHLKATAKSITKQSSSYLIYCSLSSDWF